MGGAPLSEPAGQLPNFGISYTDPGTGSQVGQHGIGLDSWTDLIGHLSPWDTVDMNSLADQSASHATQHEFQYNWTTDGLPEAHDELALTELTSDYFTNLGKRKGRRGSSLNQERALSEYSTESMISAAANNNIIIGNLLGIYHDVLENNLACWLAEENCPYKVRQATNASLADGQMICSRLDASPQPGATIKAWGRDWSNRIYRRVTQLDRTAMRTGNVKISRAQSQAASRALNLVIMAFATQWSQGHRKSQAQSFASPADPFEEKMEADFERHLQLSVWKQAKRALQDVEDVESFRVAYAEMVFGLMEKPWDEEDEMPDIDACSLIHETEEQTMHSKAADILSQDGPPVMLDRAARKMQVLKFRFEKEALNPHTLRKAPHASSKDVSDEDRETIGLLYWLAVMFDTVSAPMNERPVALGDEDCQHDAAKHSQPSGQIGEKPTDSRSRLRWNVQTFAVGDHDVATSNLQWPCSYDVAAAAIARSAPIKILIFRHLSYLQNILNRKEFGQPIEDALWEATLVYRYWNTIFAPFYRDLVQTYDTVPTRLRAWFVCIYIPWHLACLMLADIVELVDRNELGLSANSSTRAKADMVSRIRRQSAYELSELARVTAPGDGSEQLPDYHHAVNEGPLLTEPWTVLLVRAFTKTALFYLDRARELQTGADSSSGLPSQELQEIFTRAEFCTRALFTLGRKSTMSRQMSRVLYRALENRDVRQVAC